MSESLHADSSGLPKTKAEASTNLTSNFEEHQGEPV